MLRGLVDLPVLVENGAKTLGQAEKWFGAARGTDNAIIVLLGMGLGTCVISNGEVYRGATSSAGEWGHTTVVVGGRRCRCGGDGCLEAYVGAAAIAVRYAEFTGTEYTASPASLEATVAKIIAAATADHRGRAGHRRGRHLSRGPRQSGQSLQSRTGRGRRLARPGPQPRSCRDQRGGRANALRLPFSGVEIVQAELGQDAVALAVPRCRSRSCSARVR